MGIHNVDDYRKNTWESPDGTLYFNGTKLIEAKRKLAKEKEIGGVMYWEISSLNDALIDHI